MKAKSLIVVAACSLLLLPAAAWGIVALRAKREADAFYAWRSSASAALTALAKPTASTKPQPVAFASNDALVALAGEQGTTLTAHGSVLLVPRSTAIAFEGRRVLALVSGPTIDGSATCMLLSDNGEVSFALQPMLKAAFKQATRR